MKVIDTVGKMLTFMEEYIIRTVSGKRVEVYRDGRTLSLKGYRVRKSMFSTFIKEITILGKNVIFVAHDKEEKHGDDTVIRPEVEGSSTQELMKELDLVGYMEMSGNNCTISFTPTDRYYAKNSCNMPGIIEIQVLINDNKQIIADNNFFERVISNYRSRIYENIENNRKFEELKSLIDGNMADIKDA